MDSIDDLTIEPAALTDGGGLTMPLAFVALDRMTASPARPPPFPLIGRGDPAHPAAAYVDAVAASPVSAERLAGQVAHHPSPPRRSSSYCARRPPSRRPTR